MMKRGVVRIVFVGMLVALAAQIFITRMVSEPYPAIAMPGFAGNGGDQGGQVVTQSFEATFIFTDGKMIVLPRGVLLDEFPAEMHDDIAQTVFQPQTSSWYTTQPNIRRNWRYRLFPGLNAGQIDRWTDHSQASLKIWLSDRAARLRPNVSLHQVRIDWYREWHGFDVGGPTSRREAIGGYAIQMAAPAPRAHTKQERET